MSAELVQTQARVYRLLGELRRAVELGDAAHATETRLRLRREYETAGRAQLVALSERDAPGVDAAAA